MKNKMEYQVFFLKAITKKGIFQKWQIRYF